MSNITNINSTDKISDSRSVINNNFSNLNTDKAEISDIQKGTHLFGTTTGSSNAYVLTLSPAITAYTTGMMISFKANFTNNGASTINVNGLGAKTIKKNKDYDLEAGDIKADGVYTIMYDGTYFQMISQLGSKFEAKDLKARAQSPEDLTLYVQAGSVNFAGTVVNFSGGNSPQFTVPTTNPRIDLLTLNSSGTLEITQGTEAVSPSAPTYPSNKFVICEVYNRPSQTVIKESSDGVNGYIYKDVRAFIGVEKSPVFSNYQNVVSSRNVNTTYQNTTGRWMMVIITTSFTVGVNQYIDAIAYIGETSPNLLVSKGGLQSAGGFGSNGNMITRGNMTFLVPPSWYYRIAVSGIGSASIDTWWEAGLTSS